MSVYLLLYADGECGSVLGVYHTLQGAQRGITQLSHERRRKPEHFAWRADPVSYAPGRTWTTIWPADTDPVPCYVIEEWPVRLP